MSINLKGKEHHIFWNGLANFCITPKKTEAVLMYFGTPKKALCASAGEWSEFFLLTERFGFTEGEKARIAKVCNMNFEKEYESLQEKEIFFVTQEDEEYPEQLRNRFEAPRFFYYKGRLPVNEKTIAIVGARNCSFYGSKMAETIARELAEQGIGVVSGLAYGADKAAHEGALKGKGRTYGVLGCGIDICYPKSHRMLYNHILMNGGGIISEYPPGVQPLPCFFPQRNRIIAGMSDGILVTEARKKSGSLITVAFGLEYGKTIYAVPGRVGDVLSEGCNYLLKEGAKPVTCGEDILEDLLLLSERKNKRKKKELCLTKEEKQVCGCLGLHPKHLDEVLEETGLSYDKAVTVLEHLSCLGVVKRQGQAYYSLAEKNG